MARKKKIGERRHLHVDPYIWAGESARLDKLVVWYDALPARQRTRMVVELLVAAIHGELGVAAPLDLGSGEDDAAQAALSSLLANMVMDED